MALLRPSSPLSAAAEQPAAPPPNENLLLVLDVLVSAQGGKRGAERPGDFPPAGSLLCLLVSAGAEERRETRPGSRGPRDSDRLSLFVPPLLSPSPVEEASGPFPMENNGPFCSPGTTSWRVMRNFLLA